MMRDITHAAMLAALLVGAALSGHAQDAPSLILAYVFALVMERV